MREEVAIVGVGCTGFRSITSDLSYKELMFEAAVKAYEDADVDPRRDVESFVCVSEDFWEGTSIFDEYVPDQIGAVLKPVCTISADGIYGLITASMQILSGAVEIAVVEAHSKASDMLTPTDIVALALDPIFNRPLGGNPYFVAGLEMNRYMHETGSTKEQCSMVVVKNKRNALENPYAAYGAKITINDVLNSEVMFQPLSRLDMSPHADGAIVAVLASGEKARRLTDTPIWIRGMGWCSDTPWLETRDWGNAIYAQLAANMAYKTANIRTPRKEIDFVEIDDTFSYKELQHLEALGLCKKGEAGVLVEEGATERDGDMPVNASGGKIGVGYTFEAAGLQSVFEAVSQLRGEAGRRQVPNAETGLAQCWRGIPTTSGAVVILSNKRGSI
ncbi:MAG: acetyl-CoA acetyltransferase [Candidatus Geothermarchaeales archaeon]